MEETRAHVHDAVALPSACREVQLGDGLAHTRPRERDVIGLQGPGLTHLVRTPPVPAAAYTKQVLHSCSMEGSEVTT